jgi:single-strand DNA-binding protein
MIETEFLNRVELRGRVGHDPKIFSVGDAQVARFSLATNEAFRGKSGELREEVTWHNVSAWAGRNIMDFKDIRKGTLVSLVGRLRNTRYTGSDGTDRTMVEVVAGRLEPCAPAVRE